MKVVLSLHNFIFGKESNLFILPKLWRDNSRYQLKRNTKNKMMVIFQAASGMILNCSWAVGPPKLKTILKNYPRDSYKCLRECLSLWLQTDDKATWTKLVDALYEMEKISCYINRYVNSNKNCIIE